MKIGAMCSLAIAAFVACGCGGDTEKKPDAAASAAPAAVEAPAAPAAAPVDKGAVMVSVNGKKLTRGEIDADVDVIVEKYKAQIPAEQAEMARQSIGENVARQFLMRTLLLDAAAQRGVTLSDEEFKTRTDELLKNMAARPGAPKTLEELVEKSSPFGKERAMREIRETMLIQKMIDQEVAAKVKVDPAKVEAELKKASEKAEAAAKQAMDAEAKIKTLAKQLEGLKGEELAKKFAELAKANSDCPSKEKGGDLGEFTHGQMVPEFDAAAFKQEVNTVSAPVKTQFGWHLIMPTKKIAAVEAKGDTPASPEKVQASHILIMAREAPAAPTKEQVEKMLKSREEQTAMQAFFESLRAAAKIEAPGYPNLVPPPPAPAPAPAAKTVESKPVEVKPAEAKPAEAKPAEAKPAEAKK